MKTARAALAAIALFWAAIAGAQIPVPPMGARVTDQTATLADEQKSALEQTLRSFETRKGSQVVVLIVPSTAPESIEQYALRVAEQWKPGRKNVDDGALLVVAKDDRTLRIEVGYGLKGRSPTRTPSASSARSSSRGSGRGISTAASPPGSTGSSA